MPPCLDVYSLSLRRDRAMLDWFVAHYVDSERSFAGDGQELAVLPLDHVGRADDLPLERWENVPVASLDDVLAFGLAAPPRAFTVYLRSRPPWHGAVLCFARTGEVTFGVSVDDPMSESDNRRIAVDLMHMLTGGTEGTHGWVAGEVPPSLDPALEQPWRDVHNVASTRLVNEPNVSLVDYYWQAPRWKHRLLGPAWVFGALTWSIQQRVVWLGIVLSVPVATLVVWSYLRWRRGPGDPPGPEEIF